MRLKQSKGFTLVELLLAVLILAGAVSGALLLYTSSMISSQQAWDTTVAVSHAEHVLEEMQRRDSLDSILAVDWEEWMNVQGLNMLPDETVEVIFSGPESGLLGIEVKIGWIKKARINHIALKTKMTK